MLATVPCKASRDVDRRGVKPVSRPVVERDRGCNDRNGSALRKRLRPRRACDAERAGSSCGYASMDRLGGAPDHQERAAIAIDGPAMPRPTSTPARVVPFGALDRVRARTFGANGGYRCEDGVKSRAGDLLSIGTLAALQVSQNAGPLVHRTPAG
jgi:hypothetical protein